jgi:hypothetical protein
MPPPIWGNLTPANRVVPSCALSSLSASETYGASKSVNNVPRAISGWSPYSSKSPSDSSSETGKSSCSAGCGWRLVARVWCGYRRRGFKEGQGGGVLVFYVEEEPVARGLDGLGREFGHEGRVYYGGRIGLLGWAIDLTLEGGRIILLRFCGEDGTGTDYLCGRLPGQCRLVSVVSEVPSRVYLHNIEIFLEALEKSAIRLVRYVPDRGTFRRFLYAM